MARWQASLVLVLVALSGCSHPEPFVLHYGADGVYCGVDIKPVDLNVDPKSRHLLEADQRRVGFCCTQVGAALVGMTEDRDPASGKRSVLPMCVLM